MDDPILWIIFFHFIIFLIIFIDDILKRLKVSK